MYESIKMKKNILTITILAILSSCASSPDNLSTSYVSTMQYKDYDCDQISSELERVSRQAQNLYAKLKKSSDNDNIQMGVGLVLFWPTLFFLEGGDGAEATEYSRLKGERDALEKAGIEKKCARQTNKEEKMYEASKSITNMTSNADTKNNKTSIEEKLIKLKSLRDKGFVTDLEYKEKRKNIIDGI